MAGQNELSHAQKEQLEVELHKLDDLEADTNDALIAGAINSKELTPSNSTDLMKLRFRIIKARAILSGLWPEGVSSDDEH